MDSLVSTEWLAGEIGASDLRVVDATRHLPAAGRDAAAEYEAGHIPGAVFMDLATLIDASAPVDNTLPSAEMFARTMETLGLGDGSRIVLYDDSAVKTAARAWFMLRKFGACDVAILDGGIAKWKAEGRPLVAGRENSRNSRFTVSDDPATVRGKADMLANLDSGAEQVVDARDFARFSGEKLDPRAGMANGHIPGSRNLPYTALFAADGTFKDRAALRAAMTEAGIDLARPIVTTCNSGVTAAVVLFALHLIGKDDVALYDGSWSEWGADPAMPKETGAVG